MASPNLLHRWRPSIRPLCFMLGLLVTSLAIPACAWDGHFDVLGYSTRPNYDVRFKTIKVPVCRNMTYWTVTPVPGMEMDLTRAIIREIQSKTPYKVVQGDADTELICTITNFQKTLLNYTQFNTVREAETTMTVEMIWRNTRTGEILSRRARRMGEAPDAEGRQPLLATADSILPQGSKPVPVPSTPNAPTSGAVAGAGDEEIIDPVTGQKANAVQVRSTAHFRPELGESITTALQKNMDRMAVQIVSTMELGW